MDASRIKLIIGVTYDVLINKRVEVNSLAVNDRGRRISFLQIGQKSGQQTSTDNTGKWGKVQDWRLLADVSRYLRVPQCIVL